MANEPGSYDWGREQYQSGNNPPSSGSNATAGWYAAEAEQRSWNAFCQQMNPTPAPSQTDNNSGGFFNWLTGGN